MPHYWLLKTEPSTYSIADLERQHIGVWDGVRSYAARNNLRLMRKGDIVFFYHSSTAVVGIVGIATVVKEAYPDPTQYKKTSDYYDPKATSSKPIWDAVDLKFRQKFATPITLETLKNDPKLTEMLVTQKGSRLSVQPVAAKHFQYILKKYA